MSAVSDARATEVAAVDLGSNSFHMVVARDDGGKLQEVDRLRDTVRLAAGLTKDDRLDEASRARAFASLARFGQRIAGIPRQRVRAVGTNTLRKLRDADFVADAERVLGHDIEVISGHEEARLIYGGVVRTLESAPPTRLVVDIGGGSTELIVGHGTNALLMESVGMGCVSWTQRFFADGRIDLPRLHSARQTAQLKLQFLRDRYRQAGWSLAIGTSGTVRGAWHIMQAEGWTGEVLTRAAMEKLFEQTAAAGSIQNIRFASLREDRRPVFVGGIAVLAGVFDALGLDTMLPSRAALREGVVYDLAGRLADQDVRDHTVVELARRFSVDQRQARMVEGTALALLEAVSSAWCLEPSGSRRMLRWAARLHEIGRAISHEGHARHGHYILLNGDLDGFSQTDQRVLAALVRLQRGQFSTKVLDNVPEQWREGTRRLAALLRVAVVLHRARVPLSRLPATAVAQNATLYLTFESGWLTEHPLTRTDLEAECAKLPAGGLQLDVCEAAIERCGGHRASGTGH